MHNRMGWIVAAFCFLAGIYPLAGLLPWDAGLALPRSDKVRLAECLIFILAGLGVSVSLIRQRIRPDVYAPALALVLSLGFISAINSAYPSYGLLGWAWYVLALAVAMVFYGLSRQYGAENIFKFWLLGAVCFAAVFSAFFYFDYYYHFECILPYCFSRTVPGFDNVRHLNSLSIPVLLAYPLLMTYVKESRLTFGAYWVLGAFWFSFLSVTDARSAILSVLLAAMVLYLVNRSAKKYVIHLLIFLLLGFLMDQLIFGFAVKGWEYFLDSATLTARVRTGGSGRIAIWEYAVQSTAAHPWFGVGPLQFAEAALQAGRYEIAANPHNSILIWMAEWGIPATVIWIAVLGLLVVRARPKGGDLRGAVVWVALLACLIDGLFAGPQLMTTAVMLGMSLALNQPQRSLTTPARQPNYAIWLSSGLVASLCIALFSFSAGIWPSVCHRSAEAKFYREFYSPNTWPRFWTQGFVSVAERYRKEVGGQCQPL